MISNANQAALAALGRIEGYRNDLEWALDALEGLPLWRPAGPLKRQFGEALRMIEDLRQRFDRKLVVTIVGPSGAGKSTLLNALSGMDDLSESGLGRPTTQRPVVLCRSREDAQPLLEKIGEESVAVRASGRADALAHVVLVDTPDMDSTQQAVHIPLVRRAIGVSDALICLFDSENPKRKDYVDFLAPYVRVFNGESLLVVLNKCDRLDETELKEQILPEFASYLGDAWEKPVSRVLCLSARRHLNEPGWDPMAPPRHDFDQYDQLHQIIFGAFNTAGYVVDRRLENARALRDYAFNALSAQLDRDRQILSGAHQRIREAEKNAMRRSLTVLSSDDPRHAIGVNVLLYQRLAHKWLGPVGWMIALWARILIFGTGIAAMFRFGNPVSQVYGIASSIRHFKESRAAVAEAGSGERVDSALRDYRVALMREWPDIAETLVRARFDKTVRRIDTALPSRQSLTEELSALWNGALEQHLEAAARSLSGFGLQMLFNLPVLALMVYVGWITTLSFLEGRYLTGDFFLHAFLTILLILFILFFAYQIAARLVAGPDRITARAFEQVRGQLEDTATLPANPVGEQVAAVLSLKALAPVAEKPAAPVGNPMAGTAYPGPGTEPDPGPGTEPDPGPGTEPVPGSDAGPAAAGR